MSLVAIVTTDLTAITRGRFVEESSLESGVGWVPANLSLTPFGGIATPNPWGSRGDLRLVADPAARYRTGRTGRKTAFDMAMGDLTELDGSCWPECPRSLLKRMVADLESHGLTMKASFEQEFGLLDADLPPAHPFAFSALRRVDSFADDAFFALEDAGVEPEAIIAEYGTDQFEVTCTPSNPVTAADRAIAIREIVRETAVIRGWQASFCPKLAPEAVGNGVHVHLSLWHLDGSPATFAPDGAGQLSERASRFAAGIVAHMPGLTALSAPSPVSYLRLRPGNWSAAWTQLALRDREASLRICPIVTANGRDPAPQCNLEYRVSDATGNPYLVLAGLISAGIDGLRANAPARVFGGNPADLDEAERRRLGLFLLPRSPVEALDAINSDTVLAGMLGDRMIETMRGIRHAERAHVAELEPAAICDLYARLY